MSVLAGSTDDREDMTALVRPRGRQAVILAIVVVLGLGSRSLPHGSAYIQAHAGDALWATMIFVGLGLVLPRWRTGRLALLALVLAWGVEFSQLWQAEWLLRLRATTLGALVLGHGFLWIDLLRYTVGILLGVGLDRLLLSRPAGRASH
jgi:hypothetical protein